MHLRAKNLCYIDTIESSRRGAYPFAGGSFGPAQTLSPYTPQPEAGKFPGSLLGSRAYRPRLGGRRAVFHAADRCAGPPLMVVSSGLQAFSSHSPPYFPRRFKSGRPHHIPYPVTGTTQAHGGFKFLGISNYFSTAGSCGRPPSRPPRSEAPEGCNRPVRFIFVSRRRSSVGRAAAL